MLLFMIMTNTLVLLLWRTALAMLSLNPSHFFHHLVCPNCFKEPVIQCHIALGLHATLDSESTPAVFYVFTC